MATRAYIEGTGLVKYRGVSGLGSEVEPDSFWSSLVLGGDLVATSNPLPITSVSTPVHFVETQLTASPSATAGRDATRYTRLSFLIDIGGASVGDSFVFLPECSTDGTVWFPMNEVFEVGEDELVGGKTAMHFAYEQSLLWVRLNWLNGTYSATPTVDVITVIS